MNNSRVMLLWLVPVVGILVGTTFALRDTPAQLITIQVLNPDGSPAAGVDVGQIFFNSGKGQIGKPPQLIFLGERFEGDAEHRGAGTTDQQGKLVVTRAHLFWQRDPRTRLVIAAAKDQRLMGMKTLSPTDRNPLLTIQLQPTTEVVITPQSPELEKLGRDFEYSVLYFNYGDNAIFELITDAESHHVRLPPGTYQARTYNSQTYRTLFDLVVHPGDERIEKTVNLNPTVLEQIIGEPAPELRDIKGWYGAKPVTLESLRGKVVLLEFWGYWCGPCVYSMPKLFELYDLYAADGLAIVAIHDDSVKDVDELKQKLTLIRDTLWKGREPPFPVAIDGGGKVPIEGLGTEVSGMTTATYGVASWPTCILIDREGVVRGQFNYRQEKSRVLLREILEEE